MAEEVENHILAKYNLTKKVGSGAYGHVWKVTDRKTGSVLALKKIFDAFQHSVDAQRTYRQICYLHEMNHGNIIKLFNVIRAENDKDLYLVFQFMEADLHNAIGQKILKDIHNRFIMHQICKGIKYLHSAEIIHRDLKPSNILINSDCHLKICDFGLARSLSQENQNQDLVMTEEVATRWYRAPEVLLGSQNYDKSADIWSIGCILAEILIGKPIFPGNSTLNQLQRILSFTGKPRIEDIESLKTDVAFTMIESIHHLRVKPIRQWFKSDTPHDAIDLVLKMLQFNPQNRITINQALKHPYLIQFSNTKEEIESKKIITLPVSDNKKLNLKQYKHLIYERIKKIYSDIPNQTAQSNDFFSEKKSINSVHRASDVMREKSNEVRNSFNQKNQKATSTSTVKYIPSSPSHTNYSTFSSTFNQQEKQKLKKKQSLKDILKNKRQKSGYKYQAKPQKWQSFTTNHKEKNAQTAIISKYYKSNFVGYHANQTYLKENKYVPSYAKY